MFISEEEIMPQQIENAKEVLMSCGKKHMLSENSGKLLNVRELTAECHMAVGTFYHYFNSKDDLIRQIMDADWTKIIDSMDPIIAGTLSLHDKVEAAYRMIAEFDSHYRSSALAQLTPSEENDLFREKGLRLLYDKIRLFLQSEINAGRIELSASPDSAAYLLVQLFLATGRNPAMDFEELWKCMTFYERSVCRKQAACKI
jgi:AcrR family transcriptional regulator